MENHPIPQDVTGFKFKLIGSVTLKQFLYLLGGGILACVCLILPISGLIKYPLFLIFGGLGAALAFVPIEGRPMDVMLKNFLRALPAENQYIFHKKGAEVLIQQFFGAPPVVKKAVAPKVQETTHNDSAIDAKRALLYKTLRQARKPDEKEQQALSNINSYLHETSQPATHTVQNFDIAPEDTTPPALQIVTPSVTIKTAEFAMSTAPVALPTEHATAPAPQSMQQAQPVQLPTPPPVAVAPPQVVPQPQVVINTPIVQAVTPASPAPAALQPSQSMPQDVPVAKPAPMVQHVEPPTPHVDMPVVPNPLSSSTPLQTVGQAPSATGVMPNESANVTSVSPEKSLKAGFPQLPDMPNIVLGIIKDPRGRVLPNILVEIMNQQNIPVRAFKTNALGQFAAATPLPNGQYLVILEDPRKQNEFGQIQIALDGDIFQPLEIVSVDQREKLRRELFGSTSVAPQMAAGA